MLGGVIYLNSAEIENGVCFFDQKVANNISTALFYCVTVVCIISILSAVLAFPLEIPIYLRENYSAVYRCETYYLSKLVQEVTSMQTYMSFDHYLNFIFLGPSIDHFINYQRNNHLLFSKIRLWRSKFWTFYLCSYFGWSSFIFFRYKIFLEYIFVIFYSFEKFKAILYQY